MTITNHALTGALIGKFVPWPLGLPLAIASHFALDMLPHYGIPARQRNHSRAWKTVIIVDILICIAMIIWALSNHHYALYACGQIAVMPDFVWVFRALKNHSFDFTGVKSRYEHWHIAIQKYEFPKGLWIEIPLAVVLFFFAIIRTT